MGVSIWSMHFVAMLGFDPGAPVSYDLSLTLGSLALAMAGTALAFVICARVGPRPTGLLLAGTLMGLSIGGMHYLGMAALSSAVVLGYRTPWVAASIVVAVLASTTALAAAHKDYRATWRAVAALVLGAGIVAMHYTAMAAVVLFPGEGRQVGIAVPPIWLAFGVAGLTLMLLMFALAASLMDQRQALLLALRAGRLGYWEMDVVRRRLTLSEEGRAFLGFKPGEAFDQSLVPNLLTPASAANRLTRLEASIAMGTDYEADYEMLDGRWLEVRGQMIRDGAGRPHRLVGTIQDVTSHRAAFHALAQSEARQRILINELNHRVKNTLATILSIASLTARKAEDPKAFAASFQARLLSLSATHNLLTAEGWERADARSVFDAEFGHYDPDQVCLTGPSIWLSSEAVLSLGLIVHELVTNAAKYGALSTHEGRIDVDWTEDNGLLRVCWREQQGPRVSAPDRRGFGSRLIQSTAHEADLRYLETGFEADFCLRLRTVKDGPEQKAL